MPPLCTAVGNIRGKGTLNRSSSCLLGRLFSGMCGGHPLSIMYLTKFAKASAATGMFALLRTSTMQTLSQVLACHFLSSCYVSDFCWNGRGLPNARLRVPRCARGSKRHDLIYGLVSFTPTRLCSYWQDPKLFDDMTESTSPISVAAANSASISALDNFAENGATQAESSKEAVSEQRLGALHPVRVQ